GESGARELSVSEREELVPSVLALYQNDPDPGMHGAAAWLLRQWGQGAKVRAIDARWANDPQHRTQKLAAIRQEVAHDPARAKPQWFVNSQGQTFVVLPGPIEFSMGLPAVELAPDLHVHRRQIGRTFALATLPVTTEQFER